jgi:hypothetical protein
LCFSRDPVASALSPRARADKFSRPLAPGV